MLSYGEIERRYGTIGCIFMELSVVLVLAELGVALLDLCLV